MSEVKCVFPNCGCPFDPGICHKEDYHMATEESAIEFLSRASAEGRIVSSNDLTELQIAEARANNRFFVEPGGGLGWAILPWCYSTAKDIERQRNWLADKVEAEDRLAAGTQGAE